MPYFPTSIRRSPLLEHVLRKLVAAGYDDVVINVHHFAPQIAAWVEQHPMPGLTVHLSDESRELLETGGGIRHAAPLLGRSDPFLIHNVDILSVPVLLYHEEIEDDALICPMIDARRMEVYAAVYDRALRPQRGDADTPLNYRGVRPEIVGEESYREFLDRGIVYFFGNGAAKCKEVLKHPNARFIDDIVPLAKHMAPLAEMAHARRQFVDTAYFEPFYLKEFQATVAKRPF